MNETYRGIAQSTIVTGYAIAISHSTRRGTRVSAQIRTVTNLASEDDNDSDNGLSLSMAMLDRVTSIVQKSMPIGFGVELAKR